MPLNLLKPWPAPKGILKPGLYRIPQDISRAHAKCAVADGAGTIEGEDANKSAPFRGGRKAPAPDNKARGAAPDNKAGGALGARGGGSAGTRPDAGGGAGLAPGKGAGGQ